jgi:hypothetical protein
LLKDFEKGWKIILKIQRQRRKKRFKFKKGRKKETKKNTRASLDQVATSLHQVKILGLP